ncbi:peroxisome biogenesis factor 2-like [Battus philenor]|uniref:peroxisome biogenesis factor 2-like n=1 Tax=Battus philenor TaxID=42288 RepID=UPI0035CF850E
MTITYIPRVTQLDSVQLDVQIEDLFKELLFNAAKHLEPGILQPILPELELLLRTWIFKYSLYNKSCTFGQEMLSLKYNTTNLSKSKLYWYYGYTIGLRYIKDRALYSLTSNVRVQNICNKIERVQIIGEIFNFLRFIQTGKYPILIDFILGLELTADKLAREDLSDLSWTRELLWHNLIEFIGTVVSLINIFGLKRKLTNALKYVWWQKHERSTGKLGSPVMTINTVCAYCSNKPVLPHVMGCSHVFCYYCLMALQRKLYFLLEQLQDMARELPPKYQMRVPIELLSGLANCLLNDTIFEIVKGLMEIQHVTEKHLYQQRLQIINKHTMEIQEMLNNTLSSEQQEIQKNNLLKRHKEEMKQTDMKLVLQLDQKVSDQQDTLEKAGVPGFFVTNKPIEVKVQMYLLDFILRLSKMDIPQVS